MKIDIKINRIEFKVQKPTHTSTCACVCIRDVPVAVHLWCIYGAPCDGTCGNLFLGFVHFRMCFWSYIIRLTQMSSEFLNLSSEVYMLCNDLFNSIKFCFKDYFYLIDKAMPIFFWFVLNICLMYIFPFHFQPVHVL